MKKSFLFILLCGALFASCADEKEAVFELPNYCILFTHSDATGRDLLDPEVEGSLLDGHIRLTLKGDVFEPVKSLGETRLPSVSLALHHSYNEALSCYVLLFGEFAPYIDLFKEPPSTPTRQLERPCEPAEDRGIDSGVTLWW